MSEFYRELRVDNGIRKIGVNDNGDYIEISINDSSIFDRFADLMVWMKKKEKELEQFQRDGAGKDTTDPEVIREYTGKRTETYRVCCGRLDAIFGEGCCRKVFGDVSVPDEVLVIDFIEQIAPVLEDLGKERNRRMSEKYSRRRRGANTPTLPGGDV